MPGIGGRDWTEYGEEDLTSYFKSLFAKADLNGDGVVSAFEFAEALENLSFNSDTDTGYLQLLSHSGFEFAPGIILNMVCLASFG